MSGLAVAASVGGGGTINACYQKTGGNLRIANKCSKREKVLSWNRQGPRGFQGAQGPQGGQGPPGGQGPQGAQGLQGSPGTNGTNGTNGTDGTDGTKLKPGKYELIATPTAGGTSGRAGRAWFLIIK